MEGLPRGLHVGADQHQFASPLQRRSIPTAPVGSLRIQSVSLNLQRDLGHFIALHIIDRAPVLEAVAPAQYMLNVVSVPQLMNRRIHILDHLKVLHIYICALPCTNAVA